MLKRTGRHSTATRNSASLRSVRVAIRTVRVKESILRRSLAEVLADPIPFPQLTKVDEPAQNVEESRRSHEVDEATRECEAKASGGAHR